MSSKQRHQTAAKRDRERAVERKRTLSERSKRRPRPRARASRFLIQAPSSPRPRTTVQASPEQKNYVEIERLERLLKDLRRNAGTPRETEAIREIGLEIALAVREVGAMLVNVGWEQSFASTRQDPS